MHVRSIRRFETRGVRVEPPANRIASRSRGPLPAPASAFDTLSKVESIKGRIRASYSSREISTSRCSGFPLSVTRASSRILTYGSKLSFFLASSAAHQRRAFPAGVPPPRSVPSPLSKSPNPPPPPHTPKHPPPPPLPPLPRPLSHA